MKMEDATKIPQFSEDWWTEILRCKNNADNTLAKINLTFWLRLMKDYSPELSATHRAISELRSATLPIFEWINSGFDLKLAEISEDDKKAFFACLKKVAALFGNGKGKIETMVIPAMSDDALFDTEVQKDLREKIEIVRDEIAQIYWMMF